jgi:hypothetical protein
LRDKNDRIELTSNSFSFDYKKQEIITNITKNKYTGRKEKIDLFPRLRFKYNEGRAFEDHLQAYIVQNIERNTNKYLDQCLINQSMIEWIGNEVSCGVGMQRIDILISYKDKDTSIIMPIELKACEANSNHIYQIQRYVDWLYQYYLPNKPSDIQPVLVAKQKYNTNGLDNKDLFTSFINFNKSNKLCMPLKYVEYSIQRNEIKFVNIDY